MSRNAWHPSMYKFSPVPTPHSQSSHRISPPHLIPHGIAHIFEITEPGGELFQCSCLFSRRREWGLKNHCLHHISCSTIILKSASIVSVLSKCVLVLSDSCSFRWCSSLTMIFCVSLRQYHSNTYPVNQQTQCDTTTQSNLKTDDELRRNSNICVRGSLSLEADVPQRASAGFADRRPDSIAIVDRCPYGNHNHTGAQHRSMIDEPMWWHSMINIFVCFVFRCFFYWSKSPILILSIADLGDLYNWEVNIFNIQFSGCQRI